MSGPLFPIDGAVFDADGTLIDSMGAWSTVSFRYLRSRGREPRPDLLETVRTMTLPQSAAYFRSAYGIEDSVDQIVSDIHGLIESGYLRDFELKPFVPEVLRALRRSGVKLAVATATDRYLVEAALRRGGVLELVGGIVTCRDVDAGKGSPAVFLEAARLTGSPAERTLVFEDALFAVLTAKAAGFRVCAVYDPTAEAQSSEIRAAADMYLYSFSDWFSAP